MALPFISLGDQWAQKPRFSRACACVTRFLLFLKEMLVYIKAVIIRLVSQNEIYSRNQRRNDTGV